MARKFPLDISVMLLLENFQEQNKSIGSNVDKQICRIKEKCRCADFSSFFLMKLYNYM